MKAPLRHLILGGQRSGKSRHAEQRALAWCASAPHRRATVVATAQVLDDEMRQRVERHRHDRPAPLATAEVPLDLAQFIAAHSHADHLLLVDCLTLWLTQWLMPLNAPSSASAWAAQREAFAMAVRGSAGPLLLVSNEIGLGVMPMGRETRHCVDELGRVHQALAHACDQVTLMVAGWPMAVKPAPGGTP
ncbi:MAG: bifunctional adenosylcobinamide kinase/adenosylcobinamide-phosphate guanylyltransferase [Pseudomonadota bacterium]